MALSKKEKNFCELYVNGSYPFIGDPIKCFVEVFSVDEEEAREQATVFVAKPHIQEFIKILQSGFDVDKDYIRKMLNLGLIKIFQETSTDVYKDKRGNSLSPAPLRAVADNVAKTLMTLNELTENDDKNKGEEKAAHSVIFNLVSPNT